MSSDVLQFFAGSAAFGAIMLKLVSTLIDWVRGRPKEKRDIQKEIAAELERERMAHFDAITTLYDALRELHKAGVDSKIIDELKGRVSEDKTSRE